MIVVYRFLGGASMKQKSESGWPAPIEVLISGLDAVTDGSLITGASQKILHANPAFCSITGYSAEEVLGKDCAFLQGAETDQETVRRIGFALKHGRTFHGDIVNYRKDGTTFWNSLIILPVHDATGVTTHYVSVQRDIREDIDYQTTLERRLYVAEAQQETDGLLLDAAASLNDCPTARDVFQALANGALSVGRSDVAVVAVRDPGAGSFVVEAFAADETDRYSSVNLDDLAEGLRVIVPAIDDVPVVFRRETHSSAVAELDRMSADRLLAIPFFLDGTTSGVLFSYWISKRSNIVSATETLRGLVRLADFAGTCLERAVLFEHVRNSTAQPASPR